MKIIKRISDSVVLYADDDLMLGATGASNGDWQDPNTTTENAVLIEGVTLPVDWMGGNYTFDGGSWAHTTVGAAQSEAMKAQAKLDKWEAIKIERDRREAGGVLVGTHWFHTDESSRIKQLGLVMAGASIPAGLMWKTMDGSFVPMTQQLAGQIFGASLSQTSAIFTKAEQHKAVMEASENPDAYDFSGGWPKVFGE